MFRAVIKGRQLVCKQCPAQCDAFRTGRIDHSHPEASCPASPPRWGTYVQHGRPKIGLGDAVAMLTGPLGNDCPGCGKRHVGLNKIMPDIARPFRKE